MKMEQETYREAVTVHKDTVLELLKKSKPKKVANDLEKDGWPREWACRIGCGMEKKYNPANLRWGPVENQRLREKYCSKVFLGGGVFFVGLIVSIITTFLAFSFGGVAVFAYGAVIGGGATFWSGLTNVKKYPDRDLPEYVAPREKVEGYVPDSY